MSNQEIIDHLNEFNRWMAGNGDVPCTCGHPLREHLVDLTACPTCIEWEPVHLRCEGFTMPRND